MSEVRLRRSRRRAGRSGAALAILIAVCLGLCAGAQGSARPDAQGGASTSPIAWPDARLQLGLVNYPGAPAAPRPSLGLGLGYLYLSGGVNTGDDWTHWNPDGTYVSRYIAQAEARHVIPVFSYYEIRQSLPGAGNADEADADLANLDNPTTMRAYYLTLKEFYVRAARAAGPVVLQLEPDLFGYVEQRASSDDASTVPAAVSSTAIAALRGLPNTAAGFAQAVLVLRRAYAPKVIVGYHISIWGTGKDIHLNHPSAAEVDRMGAAAASFYRSLHADFDVSFTELTDRDAGYAQTVNGEGPQTWWKSIDFDRDVRFLHDYHERVRLPIVMWQIPLGNTVSPIVNNTPYHYRDNKVQWLLGPESRAHLRAFVSAGGVALLFGAGQPQGTDAGDASGDGHADDGGYFDARARDYYRTGALKLAPPGR